MIDSAGMPVAIIETLRSEVVALGEVDDRVARAESESYQTAAGRRSEHQRFWKEEVFPDWGERQRNSLFRTMRTHNVLIEFLAADTPTHAYRLGSTQLRLVRKGG